MVNTAKFLILNVMACGFLYICYLVGFLDFFSYMKNYEIFFLVFLLLYYAVGAFSVLFQKWNTAIHIANGLPIWALGGTGLTLIKIIIDLKIVNQGSLLQVFHGIALAIGCNIVGIMLMAFIRECVWWINKESI